MIVKILGLADFISIFSLIFVDFLPQKLVIIMGVYLILKGLFFTLISGDMVSMFDVGCGIYHFMATLGVSHWIITSIVVLFIFQKAFISFMS